MPTGFCSGSRRAFLKTASSAAVALGAGTIAPRALRARPALRVRHSIAALVADGSPMIDSLRAGVAAMKARDPGDPTSWWFQANIHGTVESDPLLDPFWNRCPHGNFFFLSWHRMYLYHFERNPAGGVRGRRADPAVLELFRCDAAGPAAALPRSRR